MTAVGRLTPLQADVINRRAADFSAVARGWALDSNFVSVAQRGAFLAPLLASVQGFRPEVRSQALRLIHDLEAVLLRLDTSELPPFSARPHDDGSATIEMRFPDRRLAFTLEINPEESGWHVVSARSSGGLQASGELPVPHSDLSALLMLATQQTPRKK